MQNRGQLRLLQVFTSFIFLYAGIKHLAKPELVIARIQKTTIFEWLPSLPLFNTAIFATGIIMIAGAVLLLAGKWHKIAAWALLITLIPITLSVQLENLNNLGPFFKNVAISGSLIFLIKTKFYDKETF